MVRRYRAGRGRGRGRGRGAPVARGGFEARGGNRGAPVIPRARGVPSGAPDRGGLQRFSEFDPEPNARSNVYNLRRIVNAPRANTPNGSLPGIDVIMPPIDELDHDRGVVRVPNLGRGNAAQGRGRYQPSPRVQDHLAASSVADDDLP